MTEGMPSEGDVPPNPGPRTGHLSESHIRHSEQLDLPPTLISWHWLLGGEGDNKTIKSLGRLWCRPLGSKPLASQWDGNDYDELPGLLCLRGFHNETAVLNYRSSNSLTVTVTCNLCLLFKGGVFSELTKRTLVK